MPEQTLGEYGQGTFPLTYATSIESGCAYVAWVCAQSGGLANGQTALYWDLIGTVARHMKESNHAG